MQTAPCTHGHKRESAGGDVTSTCASSNRKVSLKAESPNSSEKETVEFPEEEVGALG